MFLCITIRDRVLNILKMAKEQEFMDLFPKHDSDNDGEITKEEFIALANELGVPSLYPGSVSNMIRKLNYATPNKETININQAKEYIFSFENPPKHDIWKAKYGLIAGAAQMRCQINGNSVQTAAPAAPGAPSADNSKDEPQDLPKKAKINLLVGPPKASYNSQVDINIEKVELQNKPKPFVKLTFTSQTNERAKTLQTVFKQNFNTLLSLFAQDVQQWAEEVKNFHINSMVNDTTTTFFFTTVNEDIVDLIKVFAEMFQLTYNYQLHAKAHAKFEFDYDFQKFVDEPQSSFYDIFTKNFKLQIDVSVLNFLKAFRKFVANSEMSKDIFCSNDILENLIPISLLHLEEIDAEFQFENSDIVDYETETKNEVIVGLKELGGFFMKLNQAGMKIYELLELIDGNITVEATAGEWNAKVFLRLKNINNVFLKLAKPDPPSEDNEESGNAKPSSYVAQSDSENSYTAKKPKKNVSKSPNKKFVQVKVSDDDSQRSERSKSSIKKRKTSSENIKIQSKGVKVSDEDSDSVKSVRSNDAKKKIIKKEEDNLSNSSSSK